MCKGESCCFRGVGVGCFMSEPVQKIGTKRITLPKIKQEKSTPLSYTNLKLGDKKGNLQVNLQGSPVVKRSLSSG